MKSDNKNIFKLEDVDRESVFKAPEKYFDELPLTIQSRVYKQDVRNVMPVWALALKFTVPVIILLVGFLLWTKVPHQQAPEKLLAQVTDASIMEYLQLSDISTDEILGIIESSNHDFSWENENVLDHLYIDEDAYELFNDLQFEIFDII
jgi:hypothetical protein